MADFGFLLSSLLKIVVVHRLVLCHQEGASNELKGRIKYFDDMLMMYGKEILEGRNLEPAIKEAKKLANFPGVVKEYADYYLEMLEVLEENQDPKVISQERDRLNGIITSASYQRDGQVEIDYALVRRNIIESFVDSSSHYLMELVKQSPDMALDKLFNMINKQDAFGGADGKDDKDDDDAEDDKDDKDDEDAKDDKEDNDGRRFKASDDL